MEEAKKGTRILDADNVCVGAIHLCRCVSCGKSRPKNRCSACSVPLCDAACMKRSWTSAGCPHRAYCARVARRMVASASSEDCVGAGENDAFWSADEFSKRYRRAYRELSKREIADAKMYVPDAKSPIVKCDGDKIPPWTRRRPPLAEKQPAEKQPAEIQPAEELRGLPDVRAAFFTVWERNNMPDPRRIDDPKRLYNYTWIVGCHEDADENQRLVILMPISEPTATTVHTMPDLMSARNEVLHRFDTFRIFRHFPYYNTGSLWIPGEYYKIESFCWVMPCWLSEDYNVVPPPPSASTEEKKDDDTAVGMKKRSRDPSSSLREAESEAGRGPAKIAGTVSYEDATVAGRSVRDAIYDMTSEELRELASLPACQTDPRGVDRGFRGDTVRAVFDYAHRVNQVDMSALVAMSENKTWDAVFDMLWVLGCYRKSSDQLDVANCVLLLPVEPTTDSPHGTVRTLYSLAGAKTKDENAFDASVIFKMDRRDPEFGKKKPSLRTTLFNPVGFSWVIPCRIHRDLTIEKYEYPRIVAPGKREEERASPSFDDIPPFSAEELARLDEAERRYESEISKKSEAAATTTASPTSSPSTPSDVELIAKWASTAGGPPMFEAYKYFGDRKSGFSKREDLPQRGIDPNASALAESYPQRTFEWENLRPAFVTGSNVAIYCGLNKYTSQLVQFERDIESNWARRIQQTEAMAYGTAHEDDGFAAYDALVDHGVRVVSKPRGIVIDPSPGNGYMAASPDGFVGSDGLLEIKTSYGRQYDKPTDYWYAQVQHTMACTGREWCDLAAFYLPRNNDASTSKTDRSVLRVWRIRRDDAFVARMRWLTEAYVVAVLMERHKMTKSRILLGKIDPSEIDMDRHVSAPTVFDGVMYATATKLKEIEQRKIVK